MAEPAHRVQGRIACGAAAMLAAACLSACGGSASGGSRSATTGSGGSATTAPGATSTGSTTAGSTGTGSTTAGSSTGTPTAGSLTVSPSRASTTSQLTFRFTAPVASGVHGKHIISYSLSIVGPQGGSCVSAHEAGSPAVAVGGAASIRVGPTELHGPWCVGRYLARLLELTSAHCTGSTPCPQYVRVLGIIGRTTFTIRRG